MKNHNATIARYQAVLRLFALIMLGAVIWLLCTLTPKQAMIFGLLIFATVGFIFGIVKVEGAEGDKVRDFNSDKIP